MLPLRHVSLNLTWNVYSHKFKPPDLHYPRVMELEAFDSHLIYNWTWRGHIVSLALYLACERAHLGKFGENVCGGATNGGERLRHRKFPRIWTIERARRLLGTRFVAPKANFKLRHPVFCAPQWKTMEKVCRALLNVENRTIRTTPFGANNCVH